MSAVAPSEEPAQAQDTEHKDEEKATGIHARVRKIPPEEGKLSRVRVQGKEKLVCSRSLLLFHIDYRFRKEVLWLAEWKWFERFILLCIVVNSIMLGIYQYRAQPDEDHIWLNNAIDNVAEVTLLAIFTIECVIKTIAWGLVCDDNTYLRDPWNVLDFVVVISGLIEMGSDLQSLSFLRMFRLLRPLRSLNAVPQMKILVNTILKSMLKLGNVLVLGCFLYLVFGIIGIQLMGGIFYRRCYETRDPVFNRELSCWSWRALDDGRLCGGEYMCEDSSGFCGGHEDDIDSFKPRFEGSNQTGKGNFLWCAGEEPTKMNKETDFVHFDHIGGALLLIFQTMTLEGWTDLMYYVEDSFSRWGAIVYFVAIVLFTNFFMLNVALAVVDEVQDEFNKDDGEGEELGDLEGEDSDFEEGPNFWWDCKVVRWCKELSESPVFNSFIMIIIFFNVVNMMLSFFILDRRFGFQTMDQFIEVLELIFLAIFILEMIVMLIALGPKGYIMNPYTAFDGFVVTISVVELVVKQTSGGGGGGGLSALRTFRLFRVLLKLAKKWKQLEVLLRAMVKTGKALNYWLILFVLVMYILTLMWIQFFNKQFKFDIDENEGATDDLYPLVPHSYADRPWCPGTENWGNRVGFRQDCIPRAHFDTFQWGFITIFQVMTGENWNTIMYAGMRASERWEVKAIINPTILSAILFIMLIFFGQILFLSLFLSMLISKFDEVQDDCRAKDQKAAMKTMSRTGSQKDAVQFPLSSLNRPSSQWNSLISTLARSGSMKSSEKNNLQDVAVEDDHRKWSKDDKESMNKSLKLNREDPRDEEQVVDMEEEATAGLPGQLLPDTPIKEKAAKEKSEVNDHSKDDANTDSKPLKEVSSEKKNVSGEYMDDSKEGDSKEDDKAKGLSWCPASCAPWPYGYAWFIFSETNPLRKGAQAVLGYEVDKFKTKFLAFDTFILVCILFSTLCMMIDSPLMNPDDTLTQVIRTADDVFAVIFICEMCIKFLANGLFWGPDAYLQSGWNWLDGIVVVVSIINFATKGDGPGFLRVLRILRTFRPLRVISRNQGLKLVVQTLFKSLGDMFGLVIVSSLFLLIFALIFLQFLQGRLYTCASDSPNPLGFLGSNFGELGEDFATPLCLPDTAMTTFDATAQAWSPGSVPNGQYDGATGQWDASSGGCSPLTPVEWRRISADTPICVGRCNPHLESHDNTRETPNGYALCGRKYTKSEELPDVCGNPDRVISADEEIGYTFVRDMQRTLVVPCGGYSNVNGEATASASSVSCRENFCPNKATPDFCRDECKADENFCAEVCKNDGVECEVCKRECEAACTCQEFCTPLIKDAALCVEQGGSWEQVLSQSFDNIMRSVVTLFEISTTEGWVDVMYAAADSRGFYEQPIRDHSQWLYIILFPIWILLSFMFLINLAVGVIVEKFGELKEEMEKAGKNIMLTPAQQKWVEARKCLFKKNHFLLRDLDTLERTRRRVYNIVTHKAFENFIMGSIVVNTVIMALAVFPEPTTWWDDVSKVCNYIFAAIFTVEAILKLYALRMNYFSDNWNCFDFVCVCATLLGIFLGLPPLSLNLGTITSVIRILRIARLFRLLRFLKELNRLFMCLFISIPKLFNVGTVLLLFLILFSILGMSLFGTAKFPNDGTLDDHGNFRNFWRGFVTLFRASTGEAWNEIMHDLTLVESDYFQDGDWCSPNELFKPRKRDQWHILQAKCLIDSPNTCPGDWNPMSYFFWTAYTFLITIMIMNLVVAVILEGYTEGQESEDSYHMEVCEQMWVAYDPDLKMKIPFKEAVEFIQACQTKLNEKDGKQGANQGRLSMRMPEFEAEVADDPTTQVTNYLRKLNPKLRTHLDIKFDPKDTSVDFLSASKTVMKSMCVKGKDDNETFAALKDLDIADLRMAPHDKEKMRRLEQRANSVTLGPKGGKEISTNEVAGQQAIAKQWRLRRSALEAKRAAAQQAAAQNAQESALRSAADADPSIDNPANPGSPMQDEVELPRAG